MNYITKQISAVEHDAFIKQVKGEIYQSSHWADVKDNWSRQYVAVEKEDEICGVALILYRRLPMTPLKLAYMPRGPICDYSKVDDMKAILNACMKQAKSNHAFTLKFDPQISRETGESLYDYVVNEIGGHHAGFDKGLIYSQPNFLMITALSDDEKSLFKAFSSKTRNKIKKGMNNGVKTEKVGIDAVPEFDRLMQITGERDDFGTRPADYFTHLLKALGENGQLFLTKLAVKESLKLKEEELLDIRDEKERIQAKLDRLETTEGKKYKSLKNQLEMTEMRENKGQAMIETLQQYAENGQEEIVLSGSIMAYFGTRAYYMYAASSNEMRELLPNYQMIWTMMVDAIARGCETFDFGGVSGFTSKENKDDPKRGLYEFKKEFDSEQFETIGEFDVILKPTIYHLFTQSMQLRKKLLANL